MAKLCKFNSWTLVLLLVTKVPTIGSQGLTLEERLGTLERRMSAEGSIRAYDISILHRRLDEVVSVVNASLAQQCDKDDTEKDTDLKEVREFVRVTHWKYKSHVQNLKQAFIDQKRFVMGLEIKTKNTEQELNRFKSLTTDELSLTSSEQENEIKMLRTEVQNLRDKNIVIGKRYDELSAKSLTTDEFNLTRSEQENEIKMLRTEVQNLRDKNSELGKSYGELSAKYDTLNKVVSNLEENVVNTLQEENNVLKTKSETLSARYEYDNLVSNITSYVFSFLTFSSCKHALSVGFSKSGIYNVKINKEFNRVAVYCDQTTDGGGWLVIQRRQGGTEDFYRNWEDYKEGFGDNSGEFWLGNKYISALTAEQSRELRIDLGDFEGNKAFAMYSIFRLKGENENFALQVNGYSGNAGDSLAKTHDGHAFSTQDRDNDASIYGNCALAWKGAWWYNACYESNLNGVYYQEKDSPFAKGVVWYHWKKSYSYSLKFTEMKVR